MVSYNVGDKVEYNPQASYFAGYDGTEGVVVGLYSYSCILVEWDKYSDLYNHYSNMRKIGGAPMDFNWIRLSQNQSVTIPEPLDEDLE